MSTTTENLDEQSITAILSEFPPIIIKSGSFIIDSEKGFKKAGDINHGGGKRKKLIQYEGNFGVVQTVLVNKLNESSNAPFGYLYKNTQGIIIKVWLQKFIENAGGWQPNDINEEPDVLIDATNPLKIELPENLTREKNDHHKRDKKDKLEKLKDQTGTERSFRFGRIQILDKNDNIAKEFGPVDDNEYHVSLWDKVIS